MEETNPLVFILISVVLNGIGQIIWKKGLLQSPVQIDSFADLIQSSSIRSIFFNPYILLGLFLYILSFVVYILALSRMQLSKAYPLIGTAYIVTAVLAYFILGERFTVIRLLGILMVVSGAYLVAST